MSLFSQRHGFNPLEKQIQFQSIDQHLRNHIWSAIHLCIFDKVKSPSSTVRQNSIDKIQSFSQEIWIGLLKNPSDKLPLFNPGRGYKGIQPILREVIMSKPWYDVYDLIEYIIKCIPEGWKTPFINMINEFMVSENAGYRIIENQVVPITNEIDITAISVGITEGTISSKEHLNKALDFISDRLKPDYRNSIKESISAVEAVCQKITGKKSATLSECLTEIKKKSYIHPALLTALKQIYGYTSDSGGVRHALTEDESKPSHAEAKLMLILCSAFVGFITEKSSD